MKKILDVMKILCDTHLPLRDDRAVTPPPDAEFVIYQNESIFNMTEGQKWAWATGNDLIILQ